MFDLFMQGGPLFMGILTILFFAILAISLFSLITIIKRDYKSIQEAREKLKYIKSIGLFALVTGILGQLIGLFMAFHVLEVAGDISPSLLAGGLKVSLITTIYGILIFLISYLIWIALDLLVSREL